MELLDVGLCTLNVLKQNYQVVFWKGLTVHILLKLFYSMENIPIHFNTDIKSDKDLEKYT